MAFRFFSRVATVFFALLILFASLMETSSIKYAFGARDIENPRPSPQVNVTYALPHPGRILPGSPLWPAKVLRDKVSLEMTFEGKSKALYELHLSDKRLAAGLELWREEESSEALATFDKAESYLSQAYETLLQSTTPNDSDTLRQIAYSSLKHREVLENVMSSCGDEARSVVSKMLNTPKMVYEKVSAQMENLQLNPPVNPF